MLPKLAPGRPRRGGSTAASRAGGAAGRPPLRPALLSRGPKRVITRQHLRGLAPDDHRPVLPIRSQALTDRGHVTPTRIGAKRLQRPNRDESSLMIGRFRPRTTCCEDRLRARSPRPSASPRPRGGGEAGRPAGRGGAPDPPFRRAAERVARRAGWRPHARGGCTLSGGPDPATLQPDGRAGVLSWRRP